jgi:3-oxoadipate enol-lactonase
MAQIKSDDAEIVYEVMGDGPPVVLLHPFPACKDFWRPAAQALLSRYKVILPDLRGHGESEIGQGPAFMGKHAEDLARILDQEDIGRAAMAGVSIGGYILFEFWRRFRGRVAALVLSNTKAQPDTPEARNGRLQAASDVLEKGTEPFISSFIPKAFGKTTLSARPDLVDGARRMMMKMSPEDISLVQKGMAERPDSMPDLNTMNVPALIVTGDEDTLTPIADAETMRQHISGSQLKVVSRGGHYGAWEQPEQMGNLLRQFLDTAQGR